VMRVRWAIVVALMLLAPFVPAGAARAEVGPRTVWVAGAGHTVDGVFLQTWRAAKALLGNPISEERWEVVATEPGANPSERTVQYFDGGVLVYLPEAAPGEQAGLLPLGGWALESDRERYPTRMADSWATGTDTCDTYDPGQCRLFPETGHVVRLAFKAFWDTNGGERLIGIPLTGELRDRDGWTVQYFTRAVVRWTVGGPVITRALGAELADLRGLVRGPITQPEGVPAYDEALFHPEPTVAAGAPGPDWGPGPQRGEAKEIVISIAQQRLWAYANGDLLLTSLVSTGVGDHPDTVTPTGEFRILNKLPLQTMSGVIGGESYRVEHVPWVMYFDTDGNALHGAYWHENFGTPMSHGCVNLPLPIAESLYTWADEGTAVTVVD
jgi:hypothetical protein